MTPKCPKCNVDLKLCIGDHPFNDEFYYICEKCDGTHNLFEFDKPTFKSTWKGYDLTWCEQCNAPIITCPHCHNSSCSGGGCDKCHDDFEEFIKSHPSIFDFLNDDEINTFYKIKNIKNHIICILNDK